jgi:SAM-dependent methyltransferase
MRPSVPVSDYERDFCPAARGLRVERAHLAAIGWLQLERDDRVLDLGCGTGALLRTMATHPRAVGLDHSPMALAVARAALPGQSLVRGNAAALPFADAAFDRIAALGVLGWLDRDQLAQCLHECARVLRPGGMLLACTGRRLNAVPAWLRPRGRSPGVRSFLHARSVYRGAAAAAGFQYVDWTSAGHLPRRWWSAALRPLFAVRWLRALKPR